MALSILDGNQSATTLSTILSSGQHITAHTVVSLGTQAITDIVNATSANLTNTQLRASAVTIGGTVTVGNFPASQAVTFGAVTGSVSVLNFPASQAVTFTDASLTNTQLRASAVTVGGTVTVGNSLTIGSLPAISGTVTASVDNGGWKLLFSKNWNTSQAPFTLDTTGYSELAFQQNASGSPSSFINVLSFTEESDYYWIFGDNINLPFNGSGQYIVKNQRIGVISVEIDNYDSGEDQLTQIYGRTSTSLVTIDSALPAGTNRIGVVTIGAGTVTIGAGTAQIGSVTASISGTVPISISSVTVGNSVTIGSLPAISGTVTANTFAVQGTAVTTSNFTSTTASTVLASFNATREVLTIFNEGAGNLHIAPGGTCTTIAYQVRLSAGDYYEVPNHQTTITHSAVFATAGTARVTQVS